MVRIGAIGTEQLADDALGFSRHTHNPMVTIEVLEEEILEILLFPRHPRREGRQTTSMLAKRWRWPR